MRNTNISGFRKNLFEYIGQAIDLGDIINVNTKKGNAVVMSEEEYRGLMETLYLFGIPGMRDKILDGMQAGREDFSEIDWRNAE
jgi:PHD/YefM family antitoxin component YafN of YafNO toxin-antitoxin module